MKKYNFIIAYDIANAKRLRKVAKALEKVALRIQNSIFLYSNASKQDIKEIVDVLQENINQDEDDVRIYKADVKKSLHLKSGINLEYPNIIKG